MKGILFGITGFLMGSALMLQDVPAQQENFEEWAAQFEDSGNEEGKTVPDTLPESGSPQQQGPASTASPAPDPAEKEGARQALPPQQSSEQQLVDQGALLDTESGVSKSSIDRLERRIDRMERDIRFMEGRLRSLDRTVDDLKRRR